MNSFSFFKYFDAFELDVNVVNFCVLWESSYAWMAGCPDQAWCSRRHLAAESLRALMHINEIGYAIPGQ